MGEKRLKDVAQREQVYAIEYGPPIGRKRSVSTPILIGGVAVVLAILAGIVFLLSSGGDTEAAPETTAGPVETTAAPVDTTDTPGTSTSEVIESPPADGDPLDAWTQTTIDSERGDPSIIYVSSNFFIIAYDSPTSDEIRLRLCRDPACRAAVKAVAAEGGAEPSVAIGQDAFGIVAYRNTGAGGLNVAHCEDEACTTASISVVDDGSLVGRYSDIAIAPDLLPIISYFDQENGNLKVAHCTTLSRDAVELFVVDDTGEVGSDTSIAIGSEGFPVIAHVSLLSNGVRLVQCHDVVCASTTGHDIDLSSPFGGTAVAVDPNGLPMVSYYSDGGLRIATCTDPACTAIATYPADPYPQSGLSSTVGIHESGLPIVIYFSGGVGVICAVPEALVGS